LNMDLKALGKESMLIGRGSIEVFETCTSRGWGGFFRREKS